MQTRKAKVAITLRPDVLDDVKARVEHGAARSVSAFIERAIVGQLAAEADFDEMIAEIVAATGGPVTAEESADARRLLDGSAA